MLRVCSEQGCGRLTPAIRCLDHQRAYNHARHLRAKRTYQQPSYRRLRARLLAEWRLAHGDWCPGDEAHDAHPSSDLTLDHITPLGEGGALLDRVNLRVLCRSANSARR